MKCQKIEYVPLKLRPLLNVKTVAELLNIKEQTLYSWVGQNKIPHIMIGRAIRFDPDAIEKFIKDRSKDGA